MLRILNLDPHRYAPAAHALLQEIGSVDDGPLDRATLIERIGEYDILVLRFAHRLDRDVLDAAVRLKAIGTNATGSDHIDQAIVRARGIALFTLKGETEFLRTIHATAELTWGLLLALIRRLPQAVHDVYNGRWDRDSFMGRELAGKRLGIVGLGRIGEKIARYGQAFGMDVHATDPDLTRGQAVPGVTMHHDLRSLLGVSDVLSVHVPLEPSTVGLIGQGELALLPPGAVLVNTSRGPVIDEAALLASLSARHLGGAALDVLTREGLPGFTDSNPVIDYARTHDNLIVTPHIGGVTLDSWEKTEVFIARKIRDHFLQS